MECRGLESSPNSEPRSIPAPVTLLIVGGLRTVESPGDDLSSGHLIGASSSSNSENRRLLNLKAKKAKAPNKAIPPMTPSGTAQALVLLEPPPPELVSLRAAAAEAEASAAELAAAASVPV